MKSNKVIFAAELLGTFGLILAATGSIVYDSKMNETLGPVFVAAIHFIGLAIVVYAFGKHSLAQFNPAVTIGYVIAGYTKKKQIPVYLGAQAMGAILGSLFVKFVIGDFANLGANFPNYSHSVPFFYGIEIVATIFLMGVILIVVHIKGLNKFSGVAIGGIIALDVFFLGPISGASMNPIRSLIPAVFSGLVEPLWIYLTAPFIGSVIVGLIYKKITVKK